MSEILQYYPSALNEKFMIKWWIAPLQYLFLNINNKAEKEENKNKKIGLKNYWIC